MDCCCYQYNLDEDEDDEDDGVEDDEDDEDNEDDEDDEDDKDDDGDGDANDDARCKRPLRERMETRQNLASKRRKEKSRLSEVNLVR